MSCVRAYATAALAVVARCAVLLGVGVGDGPGGGLDFTTLVLVLGLAAGKCTDD
jgi:hypothetical protein